MNTLRLILATALLGSLWAIAPTADAQTLDPINQHRFDGFFHIGFGESVNTIGMDARYDRQVHQYVTTGGQWGLFTIGSDGNRRPVMDFAGFVKGRYNFTIGKKNYEAEAYGLFQIGPTIAFDPGKGGFNIGITPGWQVFLHKRIGVIGELGFIHRQAGKQTKLSQGFVRLGVAVILP